MRPSTFILLNPAAHGGRGMRRWEKVAPLISAALDAEVVESDLQGGWRGALRDAFDQGARIFIAAGGDGTVHALLQALMELPRLDELKLGAVGLGSSNDFHKPFSRVEGGVPLKIDPARARRQDICRARFQLEEGESITRHFAISASVGVCAEANHFFNRGDALSRWLKEHWTSGAIGYAAVRTILRYKNIEATLSMDDAPPRSWPVTNLSVSKTPFISGGLRYDTPAIPDDGLLALNLLFGQGRPGTLKALLDLSRGKFIGPPGRQYWPTPRISLHSKHPFALELDGEIHHATTVDFSISQQLSVCR